MRQFYVTFRTGGFGVRSIFMSGRDEDDVLDRLYDQYEENFEFLHMEDMTENDGHVVMR